MRRSGWSLVCLALVCLAASEFAGAQQRARRPRSRPPATRSTAPAEPEKELTVEELLQRLDVLERAQQGDQPAAPPADRSGTLVMMLEEPNLASTNYYGPDGIPYFVARLVLINLADLPVTIRTDDITLTADGARLTLPDRNPQLEKTPIQAGRDMRQFSDLKPPEEVTIPAGEKAALWLLYSGLPGGPSVPKMQIDLNTGDRQQSLDVNAYERGVLALQTERLGPEGCLALLTIRGELNTVNAGTLADELDALATAGTARAVIAWADGAKPPADQVHGWLLASVMPQQNQQYSQLPGLPAFIRELHLAHLPAGTSDLGYLGDGTAPQHATAEEAVSAALRTACEALPRDELRREIVYGHRLSRAAALLHGAGRLTDDDVPLLLKRTADGDEYVQRCALLALGQFGPPAAVQRLLEAARTGPSTQAEAAIAALAGSRYPQAHAALQEYVTTAPAAMRLKIVEVLSRHPRPVWTETIFGYVRDEDPKLRLAALQALVRIGDPRLYDVLAEALRSDDAELRAEAFARLSERTDPPSEALAMEYALGLLENEAPSGPMVPLLTRTRDPRALPLLLQRLDETKDGRQALIQLLADVGGPAVAPELLKRYPKFDEGERAAALQKLIELRAEGVRPLAVAALKSKQPGLVEQAARYLGMEGEPGSVGLLAELLESSTESHAWAPLCNALRMIGTSEARAVLMKARESKDQNLRTYAANSLEQMKYSSPAYNFTAQAQVAIADEDFEKADEFLKVAIEFDPEFGDAYSKRGHVRLKQSKNDEARTDFAKAVELDPYDHLAVTGLLICDAMAGKHTEAVTALKAAAPRFPDNLLFEYNSACVYGRALEQAAKAQPSAERDAQVTEYQVEALAHLKRSLELGFSETDWVGKDPDLNSLHEVPEFQDLLKNLPEPPTEEEIKAGKQNGRRGGQLQLRLR